MIYNQDILDNITKGQYKKENRMHTPSIKIDKDRAATREGGIRTRGGSESPLQKLPQ